MNNLNQMTDDEVMEALNSGSRLNRARRVFSAEVAGIEQAGMQRLPPDPIEYRRMEFTSVRKIFAELNIEL